MKTIESDKMLPIIESKDSDGLDIMAQIQFY